MISKFLMKKGLQGVAQASRSSTAEASPVFSKIACIGTGMMCQAVVQPMIENNLQPATNFTMFDVNWKMLETVADKFPGIQTASSIPEAVNDADLILVAVKPQNLTDSFFAEFHQAQKERSILLSVIAGKSMDVFLDAGFRKVVRSMPNTPATIGEGMTVWSATNNLDLKERAKIDKMLSSCGASVRAFIRICVLVVKSLSLTTQHYSRCMWTMNPKLTWRQVFQDLDPRIFFS